MARENNLKAKRALIATVKNHPDVWSRRRNVGGDEVWDTIHKSLKGCKMWTRKQEIQTKWKRLVAYYVDLLEDKTLKNDTTMPQWLLFHDVAFLYDYAVDIVTKKTGKKVPKFIRTDQLNSPCPCCLPLPGKAIKSNIQKQIQESCEKKDYKNINEITRRETKGNDDTHKTQKEQDEPMQSSRVVLDNKKTPDIFDKGFPVIRKDDYHHNTPFNVPLPSVPEYLSVPCFDIKDDFKIEDIDKLKDYDREVLFFSDTGDGDVILIDDD